MKTAIALVMALLLAASTLTACSSQKKPVTSSADSALSESTDSSSSSTASEEPEISAEDPTQSTIDNPDKPHKPGTTASKTSGTTPSTNIKKTLYVKDFGAKGDGKTDDAEAILLAVSSLGDLGAGSTLIFETGKTYYAAYNGTSLKSIFTIINMNNVTIKGNNTTILIGDNNYYAVIEKTTGFTLEGFNFDYKTKPAFLAKSISVDAAKSTAIMKADRDIGMDNGEVYKGAQGWFGVLDQPQSRCHMYIQQYKMIDRSKNTFEVQFSTTDSNTKRWVSELNDRDLIAPMPNVGHSIERAFTIDGNRDFTMKNCNIYAMSRFGVALFDSEGTTNFINVDMKRAPNALDQKLNFVGWRDGFHCKENRGKIIWDGCDVASLYDDVFNISASTMYVKSTNAVKDEIDMFWPETSGTYAPLRPGDALSIINTTTGQLIGKTTVKRVVSQNRETNKIKLATALPKLTTGKNVLVFFDSMVAPGSEIKNCNLDGTYRFRGPLTVSNCRINNRRMWIDVASNVEGPVPENILFKNCAITCESPTGVYFHISSYNRFLNSDSYHIKNIVFDKCQVSKANMEIGNGDSVTIKE